MHAEHVGPAAAVLVVGRRHEPRVQHVGAAWARRTPPVNEHAAGVILSPVSLVDGSLEVHKLKLGRPGDIYEECSSSVARDLSDGTGAVSRRKPGPE